MTKPSKEDRIIGLFYNEPSRHWHFKDIVKEARISENRANCWLKRLSKEKIILRCKTGGKMPFYIANFNHSNYKNKKKLYALERFYDTGFLEHLGSLDAKTVIIFGSFSRSDWHKGSDIDIFIIGDDDSFEKGKFENLLHREIQVFTYKDKKEVKNINQNLLNNVMNGYFVKGEVKDIRG